MATRAATWLSGFSSNCFRKIEARAMVIVAMITPVDSTHSLHHQYVVKAAGAKEKNGLGVSATY
jgi:hypothetical protein